MEQVETQIREYPVRKVMLDESVQVEEKYNEPVRTKSISPIPIPQPTHHSPPPQFHSNLNNHLIFKYHNQSTNVLI